MKRVVESLPDPVQMAAWGLTKRDLRVDADAYRHFAESYRRDFNAFASQFRDDGKPEAGGSSLPQSAAEGADAACRAAFEASLAPYQYHQGAFYRCRADRTAGPDGPVLLEVYEREEITGWSGIPPGPYHRSILLEFLGWMTAWLGIIGKKEPLAGKEPPPQ